MSEVNPTVTYRPIPEFLAYRAGNDGSVWSCWKQKSLGIGLGSTVSIGEVWKPLKPGRDLRGGYQLVRLKQIGEKTRTISVHRLVLLAFVGPCPDGMECCHADGNPANNQLSNLRWDTPKENAADRNLHGTGTQGSQNGRARLSEEQVRMIRYERVSTKTSLSKLAAKFGVSKSTVMAILRPVGHPRRAWVHAATDRGLGIEASVHAATGR